jgi:putative FmdB family regulatory protein
MPLYDFHCEQCESNFEARVALSSLGKSHLTCPQCSHAVLSNPMVTARPTLVSSQRWRPQSSVEQLVGAPAGGPGAYLGANRSSVLHQCRGGICSLCT